jgi:hypothetical protein
MADDEFDLDIQLTDEGSSSAPRRDNWATDVTFCPETCFDTCSTCGSCNCDTYCQCNASEPNRSQCTTFYNC